MKNTKIIDNLFDPITNKYHHPIPETNIRTQQTTKPQIIQQQKPQQTLQQQEPITDATGIGRAMSNGSTHAIGKHNIYSRF